jgi:alcohol dehydrogenase
VAFAGDENIDLIIGLGGGSAMDCAKGINFLLTNGGKMEDYWGKNKAVQKMLPSIGIPTTAGTGSEAQSFAIICQKSSHKKMACGDIKVRFKLVILDPELVLSVPKQTAVVTGIDSISHAIESYVSTSANPLSKMFAREAWKLLYENFDKVLDGTANVDTWGNMLLGAHFAGLSIENSMLGAAHAMANPITAKKNIDHGIAVGLVLPYVIKYNSQKSEDLYSGFISKSKKQHNGHPIPEILINQINRYFELANMPKNLKHYGIAEKDIESLASEAMENWTSKFNPRPLKKEDFLTLYKNAL